MTEPSKAVFLSYASEDADAAARICEALHSAGIEVWFDQSALRGGDAWDHHIRRQIRDCALFVPIISAHTQTRTEGYFRLEWRLAEERTHLMGRARSFIVPVCVDGTPEKDADVPDSFVTVQWTRIPRGDVPPAFAERMAQLLSPAEHVVPAAVHAASGAATTIAPASRQHARPRGKSWWFWPALLVLAAALGTAGYVSIHRIAPAQRVVVVEQARLQAPESAIAPYSIAVLPFMNLGSPAESYRSVGLSLELRNLLTRMSELQVASQMSSLAFKGDDAEVRRRLRVHYFVEGSYSQSGGRIALRVQLVDTETGYRLWSESIDGGSEALVEAPATVARRVVKSLNLKLSDESLQQLQSAPTTNPKALDSYLRGNEWLRAPTDAATLASAEKAFLEAVKLDPAFAMPYGGLCRVHLIRYQRGHDVDQFTAAERACHRTLSLNALQGEPYKALGALYLASGRLADAESQYRSAQRVSARDAEAVIGLAEVAARRSRFVDAERDFRAAVALEPQYWRTHASLASFLFTQARFEEAASVYERLTQFDPSHPDAWSGLGSARFMDGDFDRALAAWHKALALEPNALAFSNVGTAYFFLGRFAEAGRMYERAVNLEPKDHRFWGNLGDARELLGQIGPAKIAYETAADLARQNLSVNADDAETRVQLAGYDVRLGREDLARRALADALSVTPKDPYLYYDAAVAYTRLRMADNALDALAAAINGGYPRRLVAMDPQFQPLHATKRFPEIAR